MPTPSACSPLGQLGKLPRELRDQVYRWVLTNGEEEFTFRHWASLFSTGTRRKWTAAHCDNALSILEASSIIRQEFPYALRKWGYFSFDNECPVFENKRDDIPYSDSILNASFHYELAHRTRASRYWYFLQDASDALARTAAGRLSLFTGSDTLRDNCNIGLYNSGPAMARLVDSPLGKTISQLTGFKTVKMWFHNEIASGACGVVRGPAAKEFAILTAKIASAFENTLGPSIMSETSDTICIRDATFHPQTFLVSKNSETVSGPRVDVKEPALLTSISE